MIERVFLPGFRKYITKKIARLLAGLFIFRFSVEFEESLANLAAPPPPTL
jgi:hypothetical protein